jgi:hypothetical protein
LTEIDAGEEADVPSPSLELSIPTDAEPPKDPWVVLASNRKVLHGWESLCENLTENAIRCYHFLQADPMRRIPRRCYPLKHKNYQGVWCYEIGSGERVYYKLRIEQRVVLVYYAGDHPRKVPYPPK